MTDEAVAVTIDRLVLDGIELPADQVASFPALVESELRRILDGGWPVPGAVARRAFELTPLMLSTPPDVAALARALAERIADAATAEAASVEGAWDG